MRFRLGAHDFNHRFTLPARTSEHCICACLVDIVDYYRQLHSDCDLHVIGRRIDGLEIKFELWPVGERLSLPKTA